MCSNFQNNCTIPCRMRKNGIIGSECQVTAHTYEYHVTFRSSLAHVRVWLQKEKYLEISRRFYIESKYNTTINNSMLQVVRYTVGATRVPGYNERTPQRTCNSAKRASHISYKPLTHIGSKIRGKSNFNQFPLLYKSSSSRTRKSWQAK